MAVLPCNRFISPIHQLFEHTNDRVLSITLAFLDLQNLHALLQTSKAVRSLTLQASTSSKIFTFQEEIDALLPLLPLATQTSLRSLRPEKPKELSTLAVLETDLAQRKERMMDCLIELSEEKLLTLESSSILETCKNLCIIARNLKKLPSAIEPSEFRSIAMAVTKAKDIPRALTIACKILNHPMKRDTLQAIVSTVGPLEKKTLIQKALIYQKAFAQDTALYDLAEALAASSDAENAIALASRIAELPQKEAAFYQISLTFASHGDLSSAQIAVAFIRDTSMLDIAHCLIPDLLIRSGYISKALDAMQLWDSSVQDTLRSRLIFTYIEKGNIDDAITIADTMFETYSQATAFSHISNALLGRGNIDQAFSLASKITALSLRDDLFSQISIAYAHNGNQSAAITTALYISDEDLRSEALAIICPQ